MYINYNDNILFYKSFYDICNCIYCKFYRQNIRKTYKNLSKYFDSLGIDIEKPFELGLAYMDYDKIHYPFAQYIVKGLFTEEYDKTIGDIKVSLAHFYPSVQIKGDYFVIEVNGISFEKNIANSEIIKNLEEENGII